MVGRRQDAVAAADRRPAEVQRQQHRDGPSWPRRSACETTTVNLTTGNTTAPDLPCGMALSPDGSKLYVALNGVNQLGVIDTTTDR